MSNLPIIFDDLSAKLEGTFASQLKGRKTLDGITHMFCKKWCLFCVLTFPQLTGWTAVPYYSMCDAIIKELTGLVYFGDALSKLSADVGP